jgi:hypothetical protein
MEWKEGGIMLQQVRFICFTFFEPISYTTFHGLSIFPHFYSALLSGRTHIVISASANWIIYRTDILI